MWKRTQIKKLLQEKPEACRRALFALRSRRLWHTKYDETLLDDLADWYETQGFFSREQQKTVEGRVMDYVPELTRIANREI